MTTPDANSMLKEVVQWLFDANSQIDVWKGVQTAAKNAAKMADSAAVTPDDRKLWEYEADVSSRMTGVGLTASREIQRAAAEELTRIQKKFFVKDVEVDKPGGNGKAEARVILKEGIHLPPGYRFWWKAGRAEVVGHGTYEDVEIDTSKLPFGDTTVEVIVGKDAPAPDPWKYI